MAVTLLKLLDRNIETICAGPPHGLTINQVSAQSDINCRRSYPETKSLQTDGRTDGRIDGRTDGRQGYIIIRPFFKRAYKDTKTTFNTFIARTVNS